MSGPVRSTSTRITWHAPQRCAGYSGRLGEFCLAVLLATMAMNVFLTQQAARNGSGAAANQVSLVRSRTSSSLLKKSLDDDLSASPNDHASHLIPDFDAPRERHISLEASLHAEPDDHRVAQLLRSFHARYNLSTSLTGAYFAALTATPDICSTPPRVEPSQVAIYGESMLRRPSIQLEPVKPARGQFAPSSDGAWTACLLLVNT